MYMLHRDYMHVCKEVISIRHDSYDMSHMKRSSTMLYRSIETRRDLSIYTSMHVYMHVYSSEKSYERIGTTPTRLYARMPFS